MDNYRDDGIITDIKIEKNTLHAQVEDDKFNFQGVTKTEFGDNYKVPPISEAQLFKQEIIEENQEYECSTETVGVILMKQETVAETQECESGVSDALQLKIDTETVEEITIKQESIEESQECETEEIPIRHIILPHKCDVCDKRFMESSQLMKHIDIHTKPYACETCGKAYGYRHVLDRHIQLHTGVKPFMCEMCGESFVYRSTLNQHIRQHVGVEAYKCKICGTGFTHKSSLAKHRRTHLNLVVQSILSSKHNFD